MLHGDLLGYLHDAHGTLPTRRCGSISHLARHMLCHSLGIHHRDLKLENLLLAEESPGVGAGVGESSGAPPAASTLVLKISDFGLSLRPFSLWHLLRITVICCT